jgi:hypothetical protein
LTIAYFIIVAKAQLKIVDIAGRSTHFTFLEKYAMAAIGRLQPLILINIG